MKPIWKLRNQNLDKPLSIPKQVEGAPELITQILSVRGCSEASAIEQFLYPKMSDLKDPFQISGMKKAVERIAQAFLKNEKICIYADFDLDGTSGLALLKTGLEGLGFKNLIYHQPKRLADGYGFHQEAVDELKAKDIGLIITVDVGITANKTCSYAKEIGIDVILTDHHLPGEVLPDAYVIVNPNQPSDQSGLGYLCGAGVAFYLLRALKREMFDRPTEFPKNDYDLREVLEFFTIATLTDMVPLVEDNRVLVKTGLQRLSSTRNPGIKALLKELGLDNRPLNSQDVAIRFAPKLNALSRMENGILPIDILLCENQKIAESYIQKVMDNNSNRVQLQAEAEQLAMSTLSDWKDLPFVFIVSDKFHRGVVGLIATKMTQVTNKPCFIGSLDLEEGVVVGSGRVPAGSEICLVEALSSGSEILNRFGGHSQAAGFEFHFPKYQEMKAALKGHFEQLLTQTKPIELVYDLEAKISELGPSVMNWYEFLGPFGVGFSVPVIKFSSLDLVNKKNLKGGHLRLSLKDGEASKPIEALLFSPLQRQLEVIEEEGKQFDVLGELQWNYFRGNKSIQLLVRDIRTI